MTYNKIRYSNRLLKILIIFLALQSCGKEKNKYIDKESGTVQIYEVNEQGIPDGELEEFDSIGNLIAKGKMLNGQLDGEIEFFNDNQQVYEKRYYEFGSLKGITTFYKNGKKRIVSFWNGTSSQSLFAKIYDSSGNELSKNISFDISIEDSIFLKKLTKIEIVFHDYESPESVLANKIDENGFIESDALEIYKENDSTFSYEFIPIRKGLLSYTFIAIFRLNDDIIQGIAIEVELIVI